MWLLKGNMRAPSGDGTVVYNEYINVNILAATGKNWVKDAQDLSVFFLITARESAVISEYV